MAGCVPNPGTGLEFQVHEANRSSYYFKPKQSFLRHIIIKLSKINDKERILKTVIEKIIMYKETPTRLSADFSAET